MRFFDQYPKFYESGINSSANRMQQRFNAIIENNEKIIKNSTVLDLASHDGRWSFAALKNGAKFSTGIEGRKSKVEKSYELMKEYDVQNEKFEFIHGDVHKEISKIESGKYDVVFCLGFFYHTLRHEFLISEIKRISPKFLILDTMINQNEGPTIRLRSENFSVGGGPYQRFEI